MRQDVHLSLRTRQRLERIWGEKMRRRYAADPVAFFRECVWIPKPGTTDGRVLFELYEYQLEGLRQLREEKYLVVLKARQLGWTTLMMALALWELLFVPGTNILLVSKDQPTADKALGEMLDFMWRFVPAWLKPHLPTQVVDAAREHVWEFPNGMRSRIVSLPATDTVGAGETATRVIWDEAALARVQDDTLRTLLATADTEVARMTVFSTARGGHNRYARLFLSARRGENEFAWLFHAWYWSRLLNPLADRVASCPDGPCDKCVDRTRRDARRKLFKDEPWRFYAEYPESVDEAFRQSGRSRFAGLPDEAEYEDFEFRGWLREPSPGRFVLEPDEQGPLRLRPEAFDGAPSWSKAVVSLDPATGQGGDYTAMTAGWIDREGVPQRMGFWHSNTIEPVVAAAEADRLGRFFGGSRPAKMVVEKQGGYGDSIIHELRANLKYSNMYVHTYTGHRRRKRDVSYGFPMTATRRPLVIDRLAQWLPNGEDGDELEGIDPLLRMELGAFVVTDNGRVEADAGCHDDLVMSTAIWLYVLTEEVGAATAVTTGEAPPNTQQFTLDHLWAGVREAEQREQRRRARQHGELVRAVRRSRR